MDKKNLIDDFEKNVIAVLDSDINFENESLSISMGNFIQTLLKECGVSNATYTFDYRHGIAVKAVSDLINCRFEYTEFNHAITLNVLFSDISFNWNDYKSKYPDILGHYKNCCLTVGWGVPEAVASRIFRQALDTLQFVLK